MPATSLRDVPPAIFAVVMATGIVALAVDGAGWPTVGRCLYWLAGATYAVLWALTLARCARHWNAVRADLTSHARAPGFFTLVAATGVLGSGSVRLFGWHEPALALWVGALVLWFGLTYTILPGLMEAGEKPEPEQALSGVWLLAVVATQSICVLGCLALPPSAVRPCSSRCASGSSAGCCICG